MRHFWVFLVLLCGSLLIMTGIELAITAFGRHSIAVFLPYPVGGIATMFAAIWVWNAPKRRAAKLWAGVKYPKGYYRWGQARLVQPEGYAMVYETWQGTKRYPSFDVQVMVDGKVRNDVVEAVENNNDPRFGWWCGVDGQAHRGLVQVMVKEDSRALQEGEYPICFGK